MGKIYAIDSIVAGWVFSFFVWPQLRDALMKTLFCNTTLTQNTDWAFKLFGGSCNYAFIIFFIIPGIYTAIKVVVYGIKFYNWIQGMRN